MLVSDIQKFWLKYCEASYKTWRLNEAKCSVSIDTFGFFLFFSTFPPNSLTEACISSIWCCGKATGKAPVESFVALFEESRQWAVSFAGELRWGKERRTGSSTGSLVHRGEGGHQPARPYFRLEMFAELEMTWKVPVRKMSARELRRVELEEGIPCDRKKWVWDCRMKQQPALTSKPSHNKILCDFYMRSESCPCDFPSVALLWIVYFAETKMFASKSFLLLQRFAGWVGRVLARISKCPLQHHRHAMRQFLQHHSEPLCCLPKGPKESMLFVLCVKPMLVAPSDCSAATGSWYAVGSFCAGLMWNQNLFFTD